MSLSGRTGNRTKTSAHFNWKIRHLVVLILTGLGIYVFLESRPNWSAMHQWNRAVGDTGFVLIALSMAIGPLARLIPATRPTVLWRRELGIYGVLLALIHTAIILVGWVDWDLLRLFGYEIHPVSGNYVMVQHGFSLANIIGTVGLLYCLILAMASNDFSQRLLGGAIWKFVQQGAYVLWMLIVVHTAYFLFIHFLHFHTEPRDPNWAQLPFLTLVSVVALLQFAAFIKTWKIRRISHRTAANEAV